MNLGFNKSFIIILTAGTIFIIIGIISIIDAFTLRNVPLDIILNANETTIYSPQMTKLSSANLTMEGSPFNLTINNPKSEQLLSLTNISTYKSELVAAEEGEYRIYIKNIGNNNLYINGQIQSKADPIAFSGSMILIITGLILAGTAVRFKSR